MEAASLLRVLSIFGKVEEWERLGEVQNLKRLGGGPQVRERN